MIAGVPAAILDKEAILKTEASIHDDRIEKKEAIFTFLWNHHTSPRMPIFNLLLHEDIKLLYA